MFEILRRACRAIEERFAIKKRIALFCLREEALCVSDFMEEAGWEPDCPDLSVDSTFSDMASDEQRVLSCVFFMPTKRVNKIFARVQRGRYFKLNIWQVGSLNELSEEVMERVRPYFSEKETSVYFLLRKRKDKYTVYLAETVKYIFENIQFLGDDYWRTKELLRVLPDGKIQIKPFTWDSFSPEMFDETTGCLKEEYFDQI